MTDNQEREEIKAKRRRRSSGPQGRAQRPSRRQPTSTSGSAPVRPSSSGGGLPIGGKIGGGCGSFLILILIVGYLLLGGGGSDSPSSADQDYYEQPDQQVYEEAPTPEPAFTPVASTGDGETWLVMLYQDADDKVLEQDIFIDLNEAERVGSSENVHIVAQIDRYRAGYSRDGDWSTTRRYYITQDQDLERVSSQLIQDMGEVDMGSGRSLAEFVYWAASTFPADRYVLIMSDHGMGWPGGWSDPAPGGTNDGSTTPLASRLGQHIYMNEMDEALGEALQAAGIEKLDLIGLDACLMSQLEVYTALQPHAHYAVASEEVEPGLGWAYAGFLQALTENPSMSAEDLGKLIVQSYIDTDQRIVDPQARAEFLRGGSPMGGLFGASNVSAEQIATQLKKNITLSAINLDELPAFLSDFNAFVYALQNEDQSLVAQARSYAQSYTSIFGRKVPPSFIDLGHFAGLVRRNTTNPELADSADRMLASLGQVVVAEKHGSGKSGSTGIAIYYPNSTLYNSPITGAQSYTGIANRFAEYSLWDDFLAFHYHDRTFSEHDAVAVQPSGGITRAPGQGTISVSPLQASAGEVEPGSAVELSADVNGENIGYIYLFTGFYDNAANSLYIADIDYLESGNQQELSGVYYPIWSENDEFTLTFDWEPLVYGISDGSQTIPALLMPQSFGRSYEETVYTVAGTYQFADSGEQMSAELQFQDQYLISVYGFTGESETGAPHEITPQTGDQFTVLEKWLDLDENGNTKEVIYQESQTLTFGSEPFTWVELYAAAGDYVVGFIIEDLDGRQFPAYTPITVR